MPTYRVVLADKQKLFLQLIRKGIGDIPGINVIGEVDSSFNLLELLKNASTDLIILGIENLQDINPVKEIKRTYPKVKILILAKEKSRELVLKAIMARVDGFIVAENAYSDLITAINRIRQGGRYFSDIISEEMADIIHDEMSRKIVHGGLTEREIEVLKLRCEGNSYKHIGEFLSITPATVSCHLFKIKKKLELKTISDLRQFAKKHGYVAIYEYME